MASVLDIRWPLTWTPFPICVQVINRIWHPSQVHLSSREAINGCLLVLSSESSVCLGTVSDTDEDFKSKITDTGVASLVS